MAGFGMGLALPALAGELLPENTPEQAARLLSVRHAGITVALVLLAPVAAARIDDAVAAGREQGTALVLDAKLPPLEKLSLAGALVGDLDPVDPRAQLQTALDGARGDIEPDDQPAYDALATRADEALVAGVNKAFAPAFAICGVLALLAAAALVPRDRRVAAAAVAAAALAGGALLARPAVAPEPVTIADPCRPRTLPDTGGIDGALQDAALTALDRAACRYGSSREELALGARRRGRPPRVRAQVRGGPAQHRRAAARRPRPLTSKRPSQNTGTPGYGRGHIAGSPPEPWKYVRIPFGIRAAPGSVHDRPGRAARFETTSYPCRT